MIVDPVLKTVYMEREEYQEHYIIGSLDVFCPYNYPIVIVDFKLPFLNVDFWQSLEIEDMNENV